MAAACPIPDPVTDSSPPALLHLGQTLSQARQAEGLTMDALAARLNMGLEQLTALEAGDPGKLPEPVFVIAQARRVAESLGISIDAEIAALRQSGDFSPKAINLSELKFAPPAPSANTPTEAPSGAPSPSPRTPSAGKGALRALASVALVCGIAAGGTVLWQQWQWHQQQERLRHQAIARQAALVLKAKQEKAAREAAAKALAEAKALQATTLTLSSPTGSWLEVRTLADQPLFRGDFRGRRPFPLAQGLKVLAGRPDLVQVQIGSAQPTPLGPVTPVRWKTFAATQAPVAQKPASQTGLPEPNATPATKPSPAAKPSQAAKPTPPAPKAPAP